MMKVVYIAGAFDAREEAERLANTERAAAIALEVAKLGAMPICPHLNTGRFYGALPEHFWRAGCLELVECAEAVMIVREADYRNSVGTHAEVNLAHKLRLPVFHRLPDLGTWLDRWRPRDPVHGDDDVAW